MYCPLAWLQQKSQIRYTSSSKMYYKFYFNLDSNSNSNLPDISFESDFLEFSEK